MSSSAFPAQAGTVLAGYASDEGGFLFLDHGRLLLMLAERSGAKGGENALELGFKIGRGRQNTQSLRAQRKQA